MYHLFAFAVLKCAARSGVENSMDVHALFVWLRQISKALIILMLFALAIPLILGALAGVPSGRIMGLVFSTLILQATAVTVGLAGGLPALLVLAVMTSYAFGMVLAIFEILDTFYYQSERVKTRVDGIVERMKKFDWLQKFGIYSLVFISWLPGLGLYACPVIAWLFRWEKIKSVLLITLGFFLATLGVALGALGLVAILR
jgi:uncharacterized membrane protein